MPSSFPSCLNEAGQEHVARELTRLGLDWDASATCSEIEQLPGFQQLQEGIGDGMSYRTRGDHGDIEILADEHVTFDVAYAA